MPFPEPQIAATDTPDASRPPSADEVRYFRHVTDAAPLLLSYVDADLRYRFLNRTYSEWFGHGRGEMLGRTVPEVLGDAAFERVRPHIEAVLRGETVAYENQMPYLDGGHRFVRTSLIPDRDPNGQVRGFVGVVSDITSRRIAEENLAASEARYRSLFEHNNDPVFSFDLQGNFVAANAACERVSGYPVADLLQMNFAPLIVPEDAPLVQTNFGRAIAGETTSYEIAILHRNGHRVELAVTNSPIIVGQRIVGVYGIARDITEQKRAERVLAEAEQKQRRFLREMLTSMTEGRLHLCDTAADLPEPVPLVSDPIHLSRSALRHVRRLVSVTLEEAGVGGERAQDFITAVGEASMNAVVHAGGGQAEVRANRALGLVQVWIRDTGGGIKEDALHRATLEKGYTTAGTLGHGFWMMLKTADRIFLLTGPSGTQVVLEQERFAPEPVWLRDR